MASDSAAATNRGHSERIFAECRIDESAGLAEETADTGERFDPFCHTLDGGGQALCFADIRGRQVHTRELPTTSSSLTVLTCQRCRKVICPTCQEIEARLAHV